MTNFARTTRRLLLGSSIFAVLAAACAGGGGGTSAGSAPGVTGGTTGASTTGGGVTGGAPEPGGGGGATVVDVPVAGPSVIKTARLSLEVGKDGFADAAERATEIAGEDGGFVESSSSQGSDVRSGRLTLRIPVDRFEH